MQSRRGHGTGRRAAQDWECDPPPPSGPPAGNKTGALPVSHPGWNSSDDKMADQGENLACQGHFGVQPKGHTTLISNGFHAGTAEEQGSVTLTG